MLARIAIVCMFALALFGGNPSPSAAVERLPNVTVVEPVVPLQSFTSEAGWFARWRASHQRRAATDGWIQTDRPSFTLSDSTVPKGWLQAESGYTYAYAHEIDNSGGIDVEIDQYTHTAPELNVRWGVTDWAEVRVGWGGIRSESTRLDAGFGPVNFDTTLNANMEVGVKLQTTQQKGWIPKSAFVTSLFLPTGDTSSDVAPAIDYIYSWYLTERFSLGGSTGAVFSNATDFGIMNYFQSVIGRFHYSPRFSFFCEYYTYLLNDTFNDDLVWSPFIDTGIQYRPVANLQFDWRVGAPVGGEPQMDGIFTGVGASLRY